MKPKAKFVLYKELKIFVYKWITKLKMPDGYASNLCRWVKIEQGRTIGMKCHDCHVFIEASQSTFIIGVSPPGELQIWCKVVGINKGKVYRLGFESTKQLGDNPIMILHFHMYKV